MKTQQLADNINNHCIDYDYFWACGLIKETIELWKVHNNFKLLCIDAQTMAIHYITA